MKSNLCLPAIALVAMLTLGGRAGDDAADCGPDSMSGCTETQMVSYNHFLSLTASDQNLAIDSLRTSMDERHQEMEEVGRKLSAP